MAGRCPQTSSRGRPPAGSWAAVDIPLAPDFVALAEEARRLQPRLVRISARVKDGKTVLIIETAGLPTQEVGALSEALKAFRRERGLAAEFLIVNVRAGLP